jgi:antitoxin component YwqK of YwqJK toxin-antitoxin module
MIKVYFGIALVFFFVSCSDKFDGKNGIKTVKFPGTDIICQLVEFKNGKKNGTLKEFYQNGKLKTVQRFKDDKNIDSALYYHHNGKLAVVQMHTDGNKSGCWRKYNEAGKLYSEMNFKNGNLHGRLLTYTYKTLHLIERFNYKDGIKDGKQETFYNSGKPKSFEFYNNEFLCSGTKEWLENGEPVKNDFDIKYSEQNKVNIEDKLYYTVTLENPSPEDEVFRVSVKDTGNVITQMQRLDKQGNNFVLLFNVYKGGFVMEKVKIAAYRKTRLGSTVIKTITFNASANHF